MTHTLTQYRTALLPMTAVVAAVPASAWDAPSPCEGWSARDILAHLIQTQNETLTTNGIDLGAAPDTNADPAAAWADHTQEVLRVLADIDLVDRAIDWFFGPTTIGATFEQFYVWDMYVHRWDLARAAGLDTHLTDAELDRIQQGADSLGEALHMDGMCRPPVVPVGSDRTTQVLARLGRVA